MKEETKNNLITFLIMVFMLICFSGWTIYSIFAWNSQIYFPTLQTVPWWVYLVIGVTVAIFSWKFKPNRLLTNTFISIGMVLGFVWGNSINLKHGLKLFLELNTPNPLGVAMLFTMLTIILTALGGLILYAVAAGFLPQSKTPIQSST